MLIPHSAPHLHLLAISLSLALSTHAHAQLYISGEFVGGADIAEQMVGTGELQTLVRSAVAKDPN